MKISRTTLTFVTFAISGLSSVAADSCAPEERLSGTVCVACPTGQVGHITTTSCSWCPNGQVRGNDTGTGTGATGSCTSAVGICDPNEWANQGQCKLCPNGQVGHRTNYESCTWCPDGQVRGNDTGTGTGAIGSCTSAIPICEPEEWANQGQCKLCPVGQVGYLTGYASCSWCPNGDIRGNDTGTGTGATDGLCKPAVGTCDPNEWANQGQCKLCPVGQVGDLTDYKSCSWCPNGQVRGNGAGTGTGSIGSCTSAEDICGLLQWANQGRCKDCPVGQEGNPLDTACVWSPTRRALRLH